MASPTATPLISQARQNLSITTREKKCHNDLPLHYASPVNQSVVNLRLPSQVYLIPWYLDHVFISTCFASRQARTEALACSICSTIAVTEDNIRPLPAIEDERRCLKTHTHTAYTNFDLVPDLDL